MSALLCAPGGAESPYLFVIPTERARGVEIESGRPLRVSAQVQDPASLALALGVAPPAAGATRLELTLDDYPQLAASPRLDTLSPSFAIDFDDPAFEPVKAALVAQHGAAPTRSDLVAFVDGWISTKSLARGMDVASRTALAREGDCTEHAFLLTALARSSGRRARVAIGLAIVESGGVWQSFGHAWTEIEEAGRWVIGDAALASVGAPVYYLPFGVLDDEGPGYAFAMMRLTPRWVQRVELLGTTPAPARP